MKYKYNTLEMTSERQFYVTCAYASFPLSQM